MLKFAGPLAHGVLDLQQCAFGLCWLGYFTSPPFPGSPGALQLLPSSSVNDRYGLFGPLLADFLGHRFSIELFKRFCIDLGPQNGAKIDKKSTKNRYFGVFGAALAFYTPSLAPHFLSKMSPKRDPKMTSKSIKIGWHALAITVFGPSWCHFATKMTSNIDFGRSKVILEPPGGHFGAFGRSKNHRNHPHTAWPGGMRGAIKSVRYYINLIY